MGFGTSKVKEHGIGPIRENLIGLLLCPKHKKKKTEEKMAFFQSAVTTLQTLVVALGAGLGVYK